MIIDSISQPTHRTTKQALAGVVQQNSFDDLSAAVAYITSGGLYELSETLKNSFDLEDGNKAKRWLTSFDYLRTEPIALEALIAFPASEVRIHDPEPALAHQGMPSVPFHPKAYLFRKNPNLEYALAGSGNLSRSGISKGFEAGFVLGIDRADTSTDLTAVAAIDVVRSWYEATWSNAVALNASMLTKYTKLYEHADQLKNPTPTEDDTASEDTSSAAISAKDLQKLRVCRNFWIEAGNITRNRGSSLPGNQAMMKRMSRVYFGFDRINVQENTHIGDVYIAYNGGAMKGYSLTYSDNKMDKLVLPIPGSDGPASYDNLILMFRAIKPRHFELSVHKAKKVSSFRKKSEAVDGAFKMKSGREWGVF